MCWLHHIQKNQIKNLSLEGMRLIQLYFVELGSQISWMWGLQEHSFSGWEEDDPIARFLDKGKYSCWGVMKDSYSGWVWRKFKMVLKYSSVKTSLSRKGAIANTFFNSPLVSANSYVSLLTLNKYFFPLWLK